jgi:Zn finger protein HypA/HybF involved in hydrogenase expression
MGKVIDIEANQPHKASELICVKCLARWLAVRPSDVHLKDIKCPFCTYAGFVIETGEDMEIRPRAEDRKNLNTFGDGVPKSGG